ncbi:hypothetical protein GQX73_g6345 [Xylaria multiplex]|uniref:Ubiquitin-like domain-containing protein n=1 Tax=Xylaria multiplex TaxID=323545 RepID=A0A7C8N390_9PEZI|nr:hypothetical protein GQX73_g6345 [Xylaria multiplex]
MPVPFGFSVGDFIAIASLVYEIIRVIDERHGAGAEYQSCVSTLRSLHSCISAIKECLRLAQDVPNLELHEVALINGLRYEIGFCRNLLNEFLDSTYKYTASLLPSSKAQAFKAQAALSDVPIGKASTKRLEKTWKKLSWAVFRKEDVRKLERDLQSHLKALHLYLSSLELLSLFRLAKRTAEAELSIRNTEVTTMNILNSLQPVLSVLATLPPQVGDKINKSQPVFFEDALGRSIELPREFCVSKEGLPGHDKVVKNQYHLEDPAGTTIISADAWHLKVTAGATIAMTLLFQLAAEAIGSTSQICPKCNTVNIKPDSQQGMTKWYVTLCPYYTLR